MRLARLIVAAACAVAASGLASPPAAGATTSISVAAPAKTGAVNDIACPSPTSCWAVGDGLRTDNHTLHFVARIMHFNGKAWSTVKVAVPVAVASHGHVTGDYPLSGVACTSTRNCWAVGFTRPGDITSDRYLALHWDGRHWAAVHVATPGGGSGDLSSVACATASSCWAVGNTSHGSFDSAGQILHWDGHAWHTVSTPASFALDQVRCERGQCWAVGDGMTPLGGATATNAVLLHLVAGQWVSLLPVVPITYLSTVSCPSAASCWLTGLVAHRWGLSHWDGTTLTPTGLPGPSLGNGAVTCPSASSCWYSGSQGKSALIYHWNGTAWKALPSVAVHQGDIDVLTCASSKLCWAGGSAGLGDNQSIVLLRWNGKRWARSL